MSQPPTNDMGLLIRTHTLASSIISRHNTPHDILDAAALTKLKAFCTNPGQKDVLLRQWDMVDEPGQRAGTRANVVKGSLVGVLVARWGSGEEGLSEGMV